VSWVEADYKGKSRMEPVNLKLASTLDGKTVSAFRATLRCGWRCAGRVRVCHVDGGGAVDSTHVCWVWGAQVFLMFLFHLQPLTFSASSRLWWWHSC
jgi:hypothetical protein